MVNHNKEVLDIALSIMIEAGSTDSAVGGLVKAFIAKSRSIDKAVSKAKPKEYTDDEGNVKW